MRLLDVSTFNLVNKREHELPPYAILSHTWGSDHDEVTLQDMLSFTADGLTGDVTKSNVSRKSGFAKIAAAARLALSRSLISFGSIPAASTRRLVLNSRRRSVACSAGTMLLLLVTPC